MQFFRLPCSFSAFAVMKSGLSSVLNISLQISPYWRALRPFLFVRLPSANSLRLVDHRNFPPVTCRTPDSCLGIDFPSGPLGQRNSLHFPRSAFPQSFFLSFPSETGFCLRFSSLLGRWFSPFESPSWTPLRIIPNFYDRNSRPKTE